MWPILTPPTLLNLLLVQSQHIVADERSDHEESETEDEDADHGRKEVSKNGHAQNGHAPLNNNHGKME